MDGPRLSPPCLQSAGATLAVEVERLRKKDPKCYTTKNSGKRLAAIHKLLYEVIPQDPARAEYR